MRVLASLIAAGWLLSVADAQCAEDSPWPLTADAGTATLACNVFDATLYASGQDATRACSGSTWAAVDVSSCVKTTCSADSNFAQTDSGDTATLDCATYDSVHYDAGTDASRACASATWAAPDVSACVLKSGVTQCSAETVWFSTWGGDTATLACHVADTEIYTNSGADATRTCTGGTWDAADYTACTLKTCAASGGWGQTDVTASASLACDTHDATKYQSGASATRFCENNAGTPTWSTTITTSACSWVDCAADSPWAQTAHGASDTQGCDSVNALYNSGTDATRACSETVWAAADESACTWIDCATETVQGVAWPATASGATATEAGECATHDSVHFDAGDLTRACTNAAWGAVDDSACQLASGVTQCAAEGAWPRGFSVGGAAETTSLACSALGYSSGTATRDCSGTTWAVANVDACSGGPDFVLPNMDLTQEHLIYPNKYYIDLIAVNANRDIHLGYLKCPGEKVCPKHWIGDGICNDCFGCDRVMVSIGMVGDCSTCDYFWSGGIVDVGTFDAGDCDEFVFPSAFVEAYFDQCLEGAGFKTSAELAATTFNNKRNTIIDKLSDGGWGTVEDLQEVPNMELAARCQYANLEQCLKKNGWWYPSMTAWAEGDLKFEVASNADDATEWQSVDLVNMEKGDLLEQCVVAGLHQRMFLRGWEATNALNAMTADEKRNKVIVRLNNAGTGTVAQLQTMSNASLLLLVDYLADSSGDVDCVGAWSACPVGCGAKTYTISTAQAGAGHHCDYADGATGTCASGEGDCP